MCDTLVKNISLHNVPAIGESDDPLFVGKTSLQFIQIQDAWPIGLPTKNGFAPSSVKMCKDAAVTVVGSRLDKNSETINRYPTNRQGLNIYLKRSCPSSTTRSNNGFNDWVHFQSIFRNAENELLQIDELAVSKDGSSIVALDAIAHILYVFEQSNPCHADGKWFLQQTLRFDGVGLPWNKISISEDGLKLLIRKSVSSVYQYAVYGRCRASKKGKTCADLPDGYQFKQITADLPFPSEFVPSSHSTFSHDGKTIVVDALLEESSIVNVFQFDFDGETYPLVAGFSLHSETAQVVDIKFGGACSERIFILIAIPQESPLPQYNVEIYSRSNVANGVLTTKRSCCPKLDELSEGKLISIVENAIYQSSSINNTFTHSILTEAIDGDLFTVVSILNNFSDNCFYFNTVLDQPTIYVRLWRLKQCSAVDWTSCNFSDNVDFATNLRYDMHEYDMLSFDQSCGRYYFPFTQRITASLSTPVFVCDPNGCFYFCVFNGGGVPIQFYYFYRIHGDNDYIFFDESAASSFPLLQCNNDDYIGVPLQFNAKNCNAKDLDIIAIDKTNINTIPTPADLVLHPEIITTKATIAMRLCFAVVDFQKTI